MNGMQRGFTATAQVAPTPGQGDPLIGSSIFHVSAQDGKNRRSTVLLDDEPVWGYRHKIKRPYVQGQQNSDWKERDIRLTCAVPHSKEDQPRACLACEQMIRHGDTIKRHFTANLTCIDEGEHRTKKGAVYHDLKKLLELDWQGYEVLQEQKKTLGSLVGARFSVLRPTGDAKQSKTYGMWTPMTRVNLFQHFAGSPAVRGIMENAGKRGERISPQEAVQRLISPIDYGKELNNYTPQNAERFIMRALAKSYTASDQQTSYFPQDGNPMGGGGGFGFPGQQQGGFPGQQPQGFGQQPQQPQGFPGQMPPAGFGLMPASGFPQGGQTMPPHAAPDYSVPGQQQMGQQQGFAQQPQGFAQPQPQPGFPPQGFQQPQGVPPQSAPGVPAPGFGQPQAFPTGFGGMPPQQNGQGSVPPPPATGPQGYNPQQFGPQVGNPPGSTMPPGIGLPPQQQGTPQPSLAPWASQPQLPNGQQGQQPMMQPGPQMPPAQPQQGQQPQPGPQGYSFDQQQGWTSQFPGQPLGAQSQGGYQPMQGQQQMMQPPPQQQPQGQQSIMPAPSAVPNFSGAPAGKLPF